MSKFERIRAAGIHGLNYNLTTDDIIRQLEAWDAQYGVEVVSVQRDGFTIQFERLPDDVEAFVMEGLMEFCPDTFMQGGFSDPIELVEEVAATKTVFLWWD